MDALTIEGGVYTGLNEGARIKLFEAGTISTKGKEPIAMGTVTFSEPFSCNAVLDKAIEGEAKDYWVFIDEMAFGNLTVSFNTSNIKNKALRNSLNNYISGFALAKIDDQGDYEVEVLDNQLRLVNKSNGDFLTYYDRSNTPVSLIPTNDGFRTFRSVVTNYAQGKFWKELEIDNYDYNIELSLIPIRERADGKADTLSLAEISDEGGLPQFATDEKAVLRIQNNSSFAVYFNVLDIQPDGKVNLYLPQRNFPASELRIGPGERYEFRRNVVFYPPYGREVFKVLASFEPINLQPVFMTRGTGGTRGNLNNELEKLFADSYGTRGAGVGNFSGTDAATFSFVFEIVQPK